MFAVRRPARGTDRFSLQDRANAWTDCDDVRGQHDDPNPTWLGYSVGHWEGETLVVDSAGFNDKVWIDSAGHPTSESLHIQERFRRRDFGHMDLQITIDDPKMYTKPFTFKVAQLLLPDSDIL